MNHLNFISIALLFLFPFFCESQVIWETLPPHNSEKIEVVLVSSDGDLYGYSHEYNRLYFQASNSEGWIRIHALQNYFKTYLIKELDQQIYFADGNQLHRYYPEDNSTDIFVTLEEEFDRIEDFAQLKTGNFVVAENRNLYLYDSNARLIRNHEWWTHTAQFLIGEDKNYVTNSHGSSSSYLEFSDDLSFVGNERPFPSTYGGIYINNGIIYTRSGYSRNGGETWLAYGFSYPSSYYLLETGELISNDFDSLYICNDYGVIQESIPIPSYLIEDRVHYNLKEHGNRIIFTSDQCNYENGLQFNRNTKSWDTFNNVIDQPFADYVYAGSEENVFVENCFQDFKIKHDQTSEWKDLEQISEVLENPEALEILPNDNIFLCNSIGVFLSKNKGETWNLTNNGSFGLISRNYALFSKDSGTYIYSEFNPNVIFVTKDYGESWDVLTLNISDGSQLDELTITASEKLIYEDLFSSSLHLYDLNSEENRILDYQGQPILSRHLASSFTGEVVYAVRNNNNGNLALFRSLNGGEDFEHLNVQLDLDGFFQFQVDQFNNLYLFDKEKVFISLDQGETWTDISPSNGDLEIKDLDVSPDGFIYLATYGAGILKSGYLNNHQQYLEVKLILDENGNCTSDHEEKGLRERLITVGDISKPTNNDGVARFYLKKETYTINASVNEVLFELCNNNLEVDLSEKDTTVIEMPVKVNRECAELNTSISTSLLRRCFENTYYAEICNQGTLLAENLRISVTLDEYFENPTFNLPVLNTNGNEYLLDGGNLEIDQCLSFQINITVSCDANLGQEHCISLDVDSENTCDLILPLVTEECRENIGSYDPNDKRIVVNGLFNAEIETLDDEIEYFIRFQNTGTDTAFTVKLVDLIEEKFDIKSIRPLTASHNYNWWIDQRDLIVEFNGINLVDSFTNEPLSHGFVKFKIALAEGVSKGEELENTAHIFFDFNDPISTNTVISVVGPSALTTVQNEVISVFPNPTSDELQFILPNEILEGNTKIIDITGKVWKSKDFDLHSSKIDVSDLPLGVYLLKISNEKKDYKTKFIIAR